MSINIEKLDKRDLRRLELFSEIVEQGGISNATLTTGLSQPVLSKELITLEKSLGVVLCNRGRSGFVLTDEGCKVYNYANEINSLLSDYAAKLKGVSSKLIGHVRVGCLDNTVSLSSNPLSKAIEAYYKLSDDVELTLEIGDFTVLNEKLAKNQLDMMIVVLDDHQTYSYAHVEPIFTEESRLYARKDLANKIRDNGYSLESQRINVGGYAADTMYALLDIGQYQNLKLIDGWHVESGLMLTLAGTHISFLPTHLIENHDYRDQFTALKPEQWHFNSQFSIVLRNHLRGLSPAASAFYDCLISAAKESA
ncbi:LysR family transcriptional regulator [Vibrio breoganii]|uniref:LysR family transcriptional regulator n=1 Tax=Vibrio breoganii TaxID=553239 RepID=UPI000C81EAFE|nr:LysR family transcriptional regulator [Vibrio breoganii]PML04524.1 LysR family transcriptional regulator [Vibrio breoganii]